MIGDHLIDPFFDGNLNSEMYETMLNKQIILAIRNLFLNDFIACSSSKMELQRISD